MIATTDPHLILEPNRAHLRADGNRGNVMQKNWFSSTTKGLFRCPGCSKSFHLRCLMRIHYWAHFKPFTSVCGEHFAARERLVAHGRHHRGAREALQMLELRGRVCSQAHPQQRHTSAQPGETTDPHICENRFSGLFGAALA